MPKLNLNPSSFMLASFHAASLRDRRWRGRVRWGPYMLFPLIVVIISYLGVYFVLLIYDTVTPDDSKNTTDPPKATKEFQNSPG
jgi:hypothetical protein